MGIKLATLVEKYSHIRLALESDNGAILAFLETVEMETTGLNLRYDRSPDFFAFLRDQGDSATTFLFFNEDETIGGICVMTFRQYFVEGKTVCAAYLSDLRIHPRLSRRTRVQWRQCYSDIVANYREVEEFQGCQYLYTAILAENEAAINAMTKGKSGFVYREIMRYESIVLIGRYPLGPLRRLIPALRFGSFRPRRATPGDLPAIRKFLHEESRNKVLGNHFLTTDGEDELSRRFRWWENFYVESFLLSENRSGEIVGCVAPWTHQKARRLVVDSIGIGETVLGELLPMLGGKRIRAREEFSVLNFTHLTFSSRLSERERRQVFHSLLDTTYALGLNRGFHVICIYNNPLHSLLPGMRLGYVFYRTPGIFYQVTSKEEVAAGHLLPHGTAADIDFELGTA